MRSFICVYTSSRAKGTSTQRPSHPYDAKGELTHVFFEAADPLQILHVKAAKGSNLEGNEGKQDEAKEKGNLFSCFIGFVMCH